jgi:hypothetical protein
MDFIKEANMYDFDYDDNNLCSRCSYEQEPQEHKSCSTCIQWVDGYLTATNYKNKYLEQLGK